MGRVGRDSKFVFVTHGPNSSNLYKTFPETVTSRISPRRLAFISPCGLVVLHTADMCGIFACHR